MPDYQGMKRHGGCLNAYSSVREAYLKRLQIILCQFYDILEKAKLGRQWLLGVGVGGKRNGQSTVDFNAMKILCRVQKMMGIHHYTYVQIHRIYNSEL